MCGRFTLKTPLGKWLFKLFGEDFAAELPVFMPRYNIAPTQSILIARRRSQDQSIHLEFARWGLVPAWAKQVRAGPPLINARSETLSTKPTFRTAFKQGRCAVIADGYYEWKAIDKKHKQPFWIHRPDESPFLMAAVTTTHKHVDPERSVPSVAIVTTVSNPSLSFIHDRMPVVLDTDDKAQRWLTRGPLLDFPRAEPRAPLDDKRKASEEPDDSHLAATSEKENGAIEGTDESTTQAFSSAPDDFFQVRLVSSRVGNPRNEDARCLDASPVLWQRTLGIDEPVEPDT